MKSFAEEVTVDPGPWKIELRRTHLVVLDGHGDEIARVVRVGKARHPGYAGLEEWHANRWGGLRSGEVFPSEGREVAAFVAGMKAVRP